MSDLENLGREVELLRQQLAELQQQRTNSGRRKRVTLVLAVAVAASAGLAFSQTMLMCDSYFPYCFQQNQPANAADVNQNFEALRRLVVAKVGPTGTNAAPNGNVTTNGLVVNGSTTLGRATTTANDYLYHNGYQITCAGGEAGYLGAYCCRLNVRNGHVKCSMASGSATSWSTAVEAFAPDADGRYSLSCTKYTNSVNFPICCRMDANTGSTTCKYSNQANTLAGNWTTMNVANPTF